MSPPIDKDKLPKLLGDLSGAIDELLLSGLTTTSDSTRQLLDVSFREASRMGLLRLGSTLRVANEELAKFVKEDPSFSKKRFAFFLNRTWLLCRGLEKALASGDDEALGRLMYTPERERLDEVELVVLGVIKRHVPGVFSAFDLRARVQKASDPMEEGDRVSWSFVFPAKAGVDIPPEGYLHLPQKQGFKAAELLEGKVIEVVRALVTKEPTSAARLTLAPNSEVTIKKPVEDYDRFLELDRESALKRVVEHEPTPLDLEVELAEEIAIRGWSKGEISEGNPDRAATCSLSVDGLRLEASLPAGPEKEQVVDALSKGQSQGRPALFGTMHYELCRFVFQPLTLFGPKGPSFLTISQENIDRRALLRALRF